MRRARPAQPPSALRAPSPTIGKGNKRAFLPYGRQLIEDDDIAAVTAALRSDFLTTGPHVEEFEKVLAARTGAAGAVACANGTAALYMAARALRLGRGTTVIVPAITFAATASAPHLNGAEIVLTDVDPESGLMRAEDLERALARAPARRADAVFPVHYAGQCCDMESIAATARARNMMIVEDAAHALGSAWKAADGGIAPVGANVTSDLTTFSFHPVKTIAMGEGGAVTANDPDLIRSLKLARNHGVTRASADFVRDADAFDADGMVNPWYYELEAPGFNLRVSDINCALGLSQMKKLDRFVAYRSRLAACYDELLAPLSPFVRPLKRDARSVTAWHLYAVRIDFTRARLQRGELMRALSAQGIGTQVHYIPLHRQPYYARRYGERTLPGAEAYYASTLSLPLHVAMNANDAERVVAALKRLLGF